MPLLEIKNLSKRFDRTVVDGVSLTLDEGKILCLLGPSGCGKTTLLRLIAGLEEPDGGQVIFDGDDLTRRPSHLRQFGMMFQEFALFPHKSVFDNVAFGLEIQNLSGTERKHRVGEMLDLVGLIRMADRNVGDLSGGERQRVALARSLAPKPRLLMLDEPMGALDRLLRERLMSDIHRILKNIGLTTIFVTHDQSEALAVADIIAVISQGRLLQVDDPEALYHRPCQAEVARFLGFHNLLPGRMNQNGTITTPIGDLPGFGEPATAVSEEAVTVIVRPEAARIVTEGDNGLGWPMVEGNVSLRLFMGPYYRLGMNVNGQPLIFDLPGETPPPPAGRPVSLALNPAAMVIVPT